MRGVTVWAKGLGSKTGGVTGWDGVVHSTGSDINGHGLLKPLAVGGGVVPLPGVGGGGVGGNQCNLLG